MRTFPRFDDILRSAVFKLEQFKVCRMILGGTYVRMSGVWLAVDVIRWDEDGTRFFRTEDGVSFHETHVSIKNIEVFK